MKFKDKNESAWWVSTRDFLPDMDERVLVISKFGHITNAIWTNYGLDCPARFSPGGLLPDTDIKWWMPVSSLTDGWKDIKKEQPYEEQKCLTMGMYGNIYNGKWSISCGEKKYSFKPFVWEVLFWREMPQLPLGVKLRYHENYEEMRKDR